MGAEYLSYVKFIATEAPTFFGYIISVLAMVSWQIPSLQKRSQFTCKSEQLTSMFHSKSSIFQLRFGIAR